MFGNFLLKQFIKSKLKGVPDSEIDRLISIVEKNPDFFKKVATEVEQKVKGGQDQSAAMAEVMKKYESELKNIAH
ncbi:MAG: hypothetical protein U1D31_01065 [Patescibacteria group bacterium]|nr:hypothetical protein [bacterium]MDZ4240705.1 hypothetical protein [Patescibacteria group bacterium]